MENLIGAVIALVVLALIVGGVYLLNKYREKVRLRIFELYSLKFKINAPSAYSDPKGYTRAVKKSVKLKWSKFKLVGVVIKGEAGAIDLNDGFSLTEYFNKKREDGEFIPKLELIESGIFSATFHHNNSNEALFWQDEKSVFLALKARYIMLEREKLWPTIDLVDWDSTKEPSFSKVTVSKLPSRLLEKSDLDTLVKSISTMFVKQKRVWKAKQLDSSTVEFISFDKNSDEAKAGDSTFTLQNILMSVLGANRDKMFISYSKDMVKNVHVTGGAVDGLALAMNNGYGAKINEPETYQLFVKAFIREINREWPGEWKSQNNLLKDGRILFKKF